MPIQRVTNWPTIKAVANANHLTFCEIHKYYEGDANYNNLGEYIPTYLTYKKRLFILKYVDGCFNPYLYEVTGLAAFDRLTLKPLFPVERWFKNEENKYIVAELA